MNHNFCQSCGMPLNATSLYGSEQNELKMKNTVSIVIVMRTDSLNSRSFYYYFFS